MRSSIVAGLMSLSPLAHAAINVTENNIMDLAAGTGELGWGASGLAFGYSAGVGLNFSSGFVAAGWNAAIPGTGEGAVGSGFSLNDTTLDIGLGAFLNNQSIGIAIIQNRETGEVQVTVNGKVVAL